MKFKVIDVILELLKNFGLYELDLMKPFNNSMSFVLKNTKRKWLID